jgi:ribose transport system ATP-binding protein
MSGSEDSHDVVAEAVPGQAASDALALKLEGIRKSFPGVLALAGANLDVRYGEVHAVVGENGAGKSTLILIAELAESCDEGVVVIAGERQDVPDPRIAQRLGVAVVHQRPALLPDLSVIENMLIAMPDERRPSPPEAVRWAVENMERIGATLDVSRRISDLSVEERHLVEIAKALALEPTLLIFDEPTEPLNADEISRLFAAIARARASGAGIVYISHRIPEILEVADRLTIMRDGHTIGTFDAAGMTESEIVTLTVGRELDTVFPPKATVADSSEKKPLVLQQFSGNDFQGVDLEMRPGEIIGFAGIEGNGQRECLRALAGLERSSGAVVIQGEALRSRTPTGAARAGVAFVPADRGAEGLFNSLSIAENVAVTSLAQYSTWGILRTGRARRDVEWQVNELALKRASLDDTVSVLSGGNQQKAVLARALIRRPSVLLADEPTQGVDAGVRVKIYETLRETAEGGTPVLVVSSNAIELEGLCDRVLVFSRGQVIAELTGDEVTERNITESALTASTLRKRSEADPGTIGARLRSMGASELLPALTVFALVVLLALYVTTRNAAYLSDVSVTSMLTVVAVLGFASLGQLFVVLIGGIDISVGPLLSLVVVIGSLLMSGTASSGEVLVACLAMAGAAGLVGLVNGTLAIYARLGPVIATLGTYSVLQGIAFLLRPTPDGPVDFAVIETFTSTIGPVPIAFIVLVVVTVLLEIALRRTGVGRYLRATGSDEATARRLGVATRHIQLMAYVVCALFAGVAGLLLMTQVGIGDAGSGTTYTLTSITAVVLGGASILGGRGSFVGALAGAMLVGQMITATPFLSLGDSWQYWLTGGFTLIAAGLYSSIRTRAPLGVAE